MKRGKGIGVDIIIHVYGMHCVRMNIPTSILQHAPLPEKIASCALDHYNNRLIKKKAHAQGEWTVYAAVVASRTWKQKNVEVSALPLREEDYWTVSSATGMFFVDSIESRMLVLSTCEGEMEKN
jgi:hypothetical protein